MRETVWRGASGTAYRFAAYPLGGADWISAPGVFIFATMPSSDTHMPEAHFVGVADDLSAALPGHPALDGARQKGAVEVHITTIGEARAREEVRADLAARYLPLSQKPHD